MIIVNLIGLVLNFAGTLIVSLCAGSFMNCVHADIEAHQVTLQALVHGEHRIPHVVGLDETRERELVRSSRRLKFGLALVVVGYLLQAIALIPNIVKYIAVL
jgi:hypothetical protein